MKRAVATLALLAAMPVCAQKPWESRVDLAVPLPIELPAVPPTNPFAVPVVAQAVPTLTPLREKFNGVFGVLLAAYVDATGACRRAVVLRAPLPAMGPELQQALLESTFTPAISLGGAVPTWATLAVDFAGRIREGRVIRLQALPPDPRVPPVPDAATTPVAEARDLQIPATPLAQLDQIPNPKRFRARLDSRVWRQTMRILVEVGADGKCHRVVFLTCPDGLRAWILSSLAGWTFKPAQGTGGPVASWVQLDTEIEVNVSSLAADALRVIRQSAYPRALPARADAPPPGA